MKLFFNSFFKNTMLIFNLCLIIHTYNYGMEENNPASVVTQWNKGENTNFYNWNPVPEECLEKIYYSKDTHHTILKNNESSTLYRYGLSPQSLDTFFEKMRSSNNGTYLFPGHIVSIDGPVNCQKYKYIQNNFSLLYNAFSYEKEALVNLAILNFFYQKGIPLKTLHGLCYGCQTILYTLHVLSSNEKCAMHIKEKLNIDKNIAEGIINNLSLCILQAPMLDPVYSINNAAAKILQYATFGISVGLAAIDFWHTKTIVNQSLFEIPLYNIASYSLSYYVAYPITKLTTYTLYDEKATNTLKLLYDLRESKKFTHLKCAALWHAHDSRVGSISPEYLQLLDETFIFYGLGSSTNNHIHTTIKQRLFLNAVRKKSDVAYYPSIIEQGEDALDSVQSFHITKKWAGLKTYIEIK